MRFWQFKVGLSPCSDGPCLTSGLFGLKNDSTQHYIIRENRSVVEIACVGTLLTTGSGRSSWVLAGHRFLLVVRSNHKCHRPRRNAKRWDICAADPEWIEMNIPTHSVGICWNSHFKFFLGSTTTMEWHFHAELLPLRWFEWRFGRAL